MAAWEYCSRKINKVIWNRPACPCYSSQQHLDTHHIVNWVSKIKRNHLGKDRTPCLCFTSPSFFPFYLSVRAYVDVWEVDNPLTRLSMHARMCVLHMYKRAGLYSRVELFKQGCVFPQHASIWPVFLAPTCTASIPKLLVPDAIASSPETRTPLQGLFALITVV